ncbi:MAG: SDR family oxidoreductase [Myxococcales bacterium]|nr:SDR family oxidoreductase [Myxococcales bacterium]
MGLVEGKVAVITGAGRGIGQAIVWVFAREGAKIVINDVDRTPADETARKAEDMGAEVIVSIGSVADPKYTDELMRSAVDRFGDLDILVNNAGITDDAVAHKMTDAQWDFVIDVNLRGTFNCIRSAAPYMRDAAKREIEAGKPKHRKIVNFYSTAAIRGNPGQINYTAAKMGNVGITRTMAQEWGRFLINVNAVAPGFTDTRLTKAKEETEGNVGVPKAQRDATIARIPFGRPGKPEEIANVVLFFSSYLSDFVTGQEVNVSGGMQIP